MKLNDNITVLKGLGEKKAEEFNRANIYTLEDLSLVLPLRYEDRRQNVPIGNLKDGMTCQFKGVVKGVGSRNSFYKKSPLRLTVDDGSGEISVYFFGGSRMAKAFTRNKGYVFYGTIREVNGYLTCTHPQFSREEDGEKGILPVYSKIGNISQGDLRRFQKQLRKAYEEVEETLPRKILEKYNLADLAYALENIHFPENDGKRVLKAKYRLVFEELLYIQLGLLIMSSNVIDNSQGVRISCKWAEDFVKTLPFKMTEGQRKCCREIARDLESKKCLNRLVQGDVGSGKTVVAQFAMFSAAKSGYQSIMMAPTEILARQHYKDIASAFEPFNIRVGLLCSSMKSSEKKETLEAIKNGSLDVIIGTHAVISNKVEYNNLGLVITDEQHRFGVNQRKLLSRKGEKVNVLVMTATPIPRTLAIVLYGNLDVSQIKTMPLGQKEVITFSREKNNREEAYAFAREEIQAGRQAYVVAPLIEDSDNLDVDSAETLYRELKEKFKPYKVALVHGRMKQEEKDAIMESFYKGDIHLLVSTVVIEVGINVPNATVMIIENCERFGLAQLHQLRGRVGRGEHQSYCFLIVDGYSKIAKARAEIMTSSNDGFFIAEEDLKIRGPGEFFGTRQHGLPALKVADLVKHIDVLTKAQEAAKEILREDKFLIREENKKMREKVLSMFGENCRIEL